MANAENRVRNFQDLILLSYNFCFTNHLRILSLITTGDLTLLAKAWFFAVIHVMDELRPYSEVICIPLYSDCRLILNYCMCKLFCPEVGL